MYNIEEIKKAANIMSEIFDWIENDSKFETLIEDKIRKISKCKISYIELNNEWTDEHGISFDLYAYYCGCCSAEYEGSEKIKWNEFLEFRQAYEESK